MHLKFSHVDVLVKNLSEACDYYKRILGADVSKVFSWERGELFVRYAVIRIGQERFMLVQPLRGNLKELLEEHGEGFIYRHCYSTINITQAFDELVSAGVQPEDENGAPLSRDALNSPSGVQIMWLPKRFGTFSIEILEERGIEEFISNAFNCD